jgi:hypothetical protein
MVASLVYQRRGYRSSSTIDIIWVSQHDGSLRPRRKQPA